MAGPPSTTARDHRTRPPHTNHRALGRALDRAPTTHRSRPSPDSTTICTRDGSEGWIAHPGSLLGRGRHRADTCAQRVRSGSSRSPSVVTPTAATHSGNHSNPGVLPCLRHVPLRALVSGPATTHPRPAPARKVARTEAEVLPIRQFPCLNFASACPRGGPQISAPRQEITGSRPALFYYLHSESCFRDCSLTRTNDVLHANHISMP